MDDYIYLIFLVAWILFEFYRRSQKKSQAARDAAKTKRPADHPGSIPDLEEILMGKTEVPEPEEVAVPEPVTRSVPLPKPVPEIFQMKTVAEPDKSNFIKSTDIQHDEISDARDNDEDEQFKVNLRQAVIYSEILNRPYF